MPLLLLLPCYEKNVLDLAAAQNEEKYDPYVAPIKKRVVTYYGKLL